MAEIKLAKKDITVLKKLDRLSEQYSLLMYDQVKSRNGRIKDIDAHEAAELLDQVVVDIIDVVLSSEFDNILSKIR